MGLKDLERMKVRQQYRNVWHEDLMSTMTADAAFCCFASCCLQSNLSLLHDTVHIVLPSNFANELFTMICQGIDCGGHMPCSGRCGERHCPTCCLCCEVFCCFGASVSSTRYIIQDEFNIKTTGCDNCIIGCMVCLQSLSCLCCIVACLTGSDEINDIAECLSCIAETVYCSVCACMQTQHRIELNKRDGKLETQLPVMAAPQT